MKRFRIQVALSRDSGIIEVMNDARTELTARRQAITNNITFHEKELEDACAEATRHMQEIDRLTALGAEYDTFIGVLDSTCNPHGLNFFTSDGGHIRGAK